MVKLCPIHLVIVVSILAWKFGKWHAFPTAPIVAWYFQGPNQFVALLPLSEKTMTGRKNRALQVPLFVPYKALENFLKALYGTTEGTYSARVFRPVIE